MKGLKISSKVLLIVSVALVGLSLFIAAMTDNDLDNQLYVLFQVYLTVLLGLGVGVFLMFTKNDVAKKIGAGFVAVAMLFSFINSALVLKLGSDFDGKTAVSAIFIVIAVVLYIAHYVLVLITNLMNKANNSGGDVRVKHIKEWKALMDDGIITSEEFEEKKKQILG